MEDFNLPRKNWILFAIFLLVAGLPSFSQTPEQEVEAVIRSLFDGMKQKNVPQVEAAFSKEGLMQTVLQKPEGTSIASNSVADFLNRIASTPASTVLDEQILSYHIQVDGPLAIAWTPYKFYVNNSFSHCGVNSFQLVKLPGGWKIVYIIDTRRKEPCEEIL